MKATRSTTLANGAIITVEARAELIAETVSNDWERFESGKQTLIEGYDVKAELNGKTVESRAQMTWIDTSASRNAERVARGQVAILGKTIGLRQDAAEKVQAAIDDAVAAVQTDEITQYKAQRDAAYAQHLKEIEAYEAHVAKIEGTE